MPIKKLKNVTCKKSSRELMRKIIDTQIKMGEIDIPDIKIELDNRDEIPQTLRGLQYIYCNHEIRQKVFDILWDIIPDNIDYNNGREGMNLWKILVLGVIRLSCNCDYDKLQELANNHFTLRLFLGHSIFDFDFNYHRQTLNDNLRLFTPAVLQRINEVVVNGGVEFLKKQAENVSLDDARCDSFVVETDVHFPTDINLLWDALRKTIELCSKVAEKISLSGWRQAKYLCRKFKKQFRKVQKEREKDKTSAATMSATHAYITDAIDLFGRAQDTVDQIGTNEFGLGIGSRIQYFIDNGKTQIDQIERRCFQDEKIPHSEKIFSLFESHTEWISKGKAGVPQELGLRVCIMESSTKFILHYKVMENETDVEVAQEMVEETRKLYPNIKSVSFDKGFHSPANQEALGKMLDHCVLPRKGKLTEEQREIEGSEDFKKRRYKHAAVESAINGLEHNGLDKCLDHSLEGFKSYVGLAVLSRNIQLLGMFIRREELQSRSKAA